MNQHVSIAAGICPHCGAQKTSKTLDMSLDMLGLQVAFGDRWYPVSRQHAIILKCLADAYPVAVDARSMMTVVWNNRPPASKDNLRVVVSHIRQRLRDIGAPVQIKSRGQVGYWLEVA